MKTVNEVFYIEEHVITCYPYESDKSVKNDNLGVLEDYMNKTYSRKEIRELMAKLIVHHPYIEGSMRVSVDIMRKEIGSYIEFYQTLTFENTEHEEQEIGDKEIKFEVAD